MHEILAALEPGVRVLDLGCRDGSFSEEATQATVVRLDRGIPSQPRCGELFVQADAAYLPFADRTFAAIVSNHSLEHFDNPDGAMREMGRVVTTGGALYVAVPDASTLTDKLYRWLAHGGGHVNAFTSAVRTAGEIERATGLRHVATRVLCSSLSFLNRHNCPRPPRRLLLLGGGYEWSLFVFTWLSRRIDRVFAARTSVYGWAFYFGAAGAIETMPRRNVCIRCGAGFPATELRARTRFRGVRLFDCPRCGAANPFSKDW